MSGADRPCVIRARASETGVKFDELTPGQFLAPRPVFSPESHVGRVALVGNQMALLGGDTIRIEIEVDPGVALEIIEPAALVAYNSRGAESFWEAHIRLGASSTLIWDCAPFISAEGAVPTRTTSISMDDDARLLLGDQLVLGRSGEDAAVLRSLTRVQRNGWEMLHEDLDVRQHLKNERSILNGMKTVSSILAIGRENLTTLPLQAPETTNSLVTPMLIEAPEKLAQRAGLLDSSRNYTGGMLARWIHHQAHHEASNRTVTWETLRKATLCTPKV